MESVFYKYGFKQRLPVSYLFLELFAKSIEKYGSESDDNAAALLQPVLEALGQDFHSEDLINQVLQDLHEYRKVRDEKSKGKTTGKRGKRVFGSEFVAWFGRLELDQTLLLLTNFDFDKAYTLYSEVPAIEVDKMIETKMGYEWTWAESNFEAVVFGMGGSFKGGKSADKSFEAPKTDADRVERDNALKNLGFM